MWVRDRIDFVEGSKCYFCNRKLKKNIAHILKNELSKEIASGPTCAANRISNGSERIPNFTKASIEDLKEKEENLIETVKTEEIEINKDREERSEEGIEEVEYLRLRAEKLVGFKGNVFPKLTEVYERYLSAGKKLEDKDLFYLENLIKSQKEKNTVFSIKNLQTCYAYSFWLQLLINKADEKDVAISMLDYLRRNLRLTPNQIRFINKTYKNVREMPKLNENAFTKIGT